MIYKTKKPLPIDVRQRVNKRILLKKPNDTEIHCQGNRKKFDRFLLPHSLDYYSTLFPFLRAHSKSEWVSVRCCFHQDRNPSLRLNVHSGAFRCFGCGACGADVLAFHMQHNNMSFVAAVTFFGAWIDER